MVGLDHLMVAVASQEAAEGRSCQDLMAGVLAVVVEVEAVLEAEVAMALVVHRELLCRWCLGQVLLEACYLLVVWS